MGSPRLGIGTSTVDLLPASTPWYLHWAVAVLVDCEDAGRRRRGWRMLGHKSAALGMADSTGAACPGQGGIRTAMGQASHILAAAATTEARLAGMLRRPKDAWSP